MQGKAWCFGVIRNLRGTKRTAVFHVATERLTDFRQLNADLVGAACFESAFELGEVPDPAERPDVSDVLYSFNLNKFKLYKKVILIIIINFIIFKFKKSSSK